ncbi:BPTD_3080 family restriction endonuclease [Minwuia thermotolerans]|uniref:Restriction endonuclease n=1 Tax=Minwuia thermotolerans TaxID=2056226 RepID=A0A2M9FXY2_9PROT|nr:DEAD/DEAH box helicase family protein [Minwuia thermotolerans]PJK28317.1 restriction endonuclease [Minwuia thermotolerans]
MADSFFEKPILNSPYGYPGRHWELDDDGQPTNRIIDTRRHSELITPVPQSKKGKKSSRAGQGDLLTEADGQEYVLKPIVNRIRAEVDVWRRLPSESQWRVTPHTARLLRHWREHQFNDVRPFFCQVEAAETAIWLAEVASRERPAHFALNHLQDANGDANPELFRIALKLATGAGKTTVMAMLIAWQTINAVRMPGSNRFSRSFLIVAPGITIRDRLRVLLPNDPENYYRTRELVPQDMLDDVLKAKIVVTNYHAFKHRVTTDVARGTQKAIEGRDGKMALLETDGQMLRRVMPELMHDKAIVVINDEAHHCYRERPLSAEEKLKGDEKKEADENNAAARLWISGLEAIRRHRGMGIRTVYDLSATPFFLRGSGYREGTLFPWTVSDFSLVDAIESGIVKLPRVPIADNIPGGDMPQYRNLWDTIGKKMPKKGLLKGGKPVDSHSIPIQLQTALEALYGHYEKVFDLWEDNDIGVPPVFIVVCNNTTTSKLVHDYISGFFRHHDDESRTFEQGRLKLFRNYDDNGERLARPRTLLIDSAQLESGEALDRNFREIATDEIDRFRDDIVQRTGDRNAADNITDQDLLREVMNTVGKKGRLGESIRCVVSVSMLTEGWDANTVTHILGVRAFGTQLLCEQVVGRGLRRQSYDVDPDTGLFDAEYADILGIPFDFTAQPVVAPPKPPKKTTNIRAVRPERDHLEIRFPRVRGYRVDLPPEKLVPKFTAESKLVLTPDLVGATKTVNSGLIGEKAQLSVEHLRDTRPSSIVYNLTHHLLLHKYRDAGGDAKLHLFGQLKRIARVWIDQCLECKGGTFPAQLMYREIADMAACRIADAVTAQMLDQRPVRAILDPFNPAGSTMHVNFNSSSDKLWPTNLDKSHVNYVVWDSTWEEQFCRVAEQHPRVMAYVKNQGLGLEVPYRYGSGQRTYIPDFVVRIDDGRGADDPLNLVVEISGYPKGDKAEKVSTMNTYWVPGVNNLGSHGRWAFAEFTEVFEIDDAFDRLIEGFVRESAAA